MAQYRLTLHSRKRSMHEGELIFDEKKGLYSAQQAAKLLGVDVQIVYKAIKEKRIKYIRKGYFYVLHIDDIKEYGEKNKNRF